MGTEIAKLAWEKPTNVGGLRRFTEAVLPMLPVANTVEGKRMLQALFTCCMKTPKLMNCTPVSLFGGVLAAAELRLELAGPTGQAYLVPYKNECQLQIGYKGFVQLAHRSSLVKRITPRVVYQGDQFHIQYGTTQVIVHHPKFPQEGDPVGYYCVAEMVNGGTDFEYMTLEEMAKHRGRFAKSQGIWEAHFDEMAKKTMIRKLAKRLPVSVELAKAVGYDEEAEADVPQHLSALVPTDTVPGAGPDEDLEGEIERLERERGEA